MYVRAGSNTPSTLAVAWCRIWHIDNSQCVPRRAVPKYLSQIFIHIPKLEEGIVKKSILQDKYPVFALELNKSETDFKTADEIIDHLKARIEDHTAARFIAVFDHYAHTESLEDGEISTDILDAKNIVFCFGIALPTASVMAVRPRSIGVTEMADTFVINFLEAPMPVANTAMENWAMALRNAHETV